MCDRLPEAVRYHLQAFTLHAELGDPQEGEDRDALRTIRDSMGADVFLATIRPLMDEASIPQGILTPW